MTSDVSKLREQALAVSAEAAAAESSRDRVATELRGFGALGILAILVILAGNLVFLPLSAILVLVWAHRSRTPWSEIGYVRPKSWTRTVAVGMAFGIALKFLRSARPDFTAITRKAGECGT